jgi:hypothetical protein
MLKSALLLTTGIVVGAVAIQGLHAATSGAPVYTVYEANVKDEAAYTAALPDVDKIIKDNTGVRVAGGFNKAKSVNGTAVGNRYVVIKWESDTAFYKAQMGGLEAWIKKYAPADARQIVVEAVEAK